MAELAPFPYLRTATILLPVLTWGKGDRRALIPKVGCLFYVKMEVTLPLVRRARSELSRDDNIVHIMGPGKWIVGSAEDSHLPKPPADLLPVTVGGAGNGPLGR